MKFNYYLFVFLFVLAFVVPFNVDATLYKVPNPVSTDSIESSSYFEKEYYKVTTPSDEDNVIYVEGKTKITTTRFCIRLVNHSGGSYITAFVTPDDIGEFSIRIDTSYGNYDVPTVIDNKGTVVLANESWGTKPGYKSVDVIPAGFYHLTIARATTVSDGDVSQGVAWYNGPLGGSKGYAYKEVLLMIKSGDENNPKVVNYPTAITNNNLIRDLYEKKDYDVNSYLGSYVRYKDKYMNDISFVFTNPKTKVVTSMTSSRIDYLKKVSDSITINSLDDYDKVLKIYEYITSKVYYDSYAYTAGKYQYSNPYLNIYNMRNNISSANSKNGKVATTCHGYAVMIVALARANNIPARLVYGYHISYPVSIWSDKTNADMSKRSHWWSEVYVNNRWVIIDANAGTLNKWNRTSFSDPGTWSVGATNYAGFDPSIEQISNTYSYNNIYKGSSLGRYMNKKDETSKLRTFLNKKYSNVSNGKRLNNNYSPDIFSTWNNNKSGNITTNGYGRISKILWGDESLYGYMDVSDFSSLIYLSLYSNKITGVNLANCYSLTYFSGNYNLINKFDSSTASKLTYIGLKGNKLSSVKFKYGSRIIYIKRNVVGGNFGFVYNKNYNKKITIYASYPYKGYKYLGIYNSSGTRVSKYRTFSFNPGSNIYYVKYARK